MTDNEIIRHLEALVEMDKYSRLNFPHECLDLIKRQKAEIERLQAENKLFVVYKGQRGFGKVFFFRELEKQIKSEAIKEFAERLKSTNLYEFIEEYYENAELCYEVRQDQFEEYCDSLVKEMVGDDNAND